MINGRPEWANFPRATDALNSYGWYLAVAAAFLIPIKLTLCYIALFPLIALWLLGGDLRIVRSPVVGSLLLFVVVAFLSGLLGIAPVHSGIASLRLTLSLLAVPAVAAVTRDRLQLVLAAIGGQTVAAIATCLSLGIGVYIPKYFVGPVTESGQLAFVIPLAVGVLLASRARGKKIQLGVAVSVLIMTAALLLNAKRGPFIACFGGLGLLCLLRSPRLLIPLGLGYAALAFSAPSLHERLAASAEHFFIAGGRNEMWSIGAELISRYPLGIGFQNSAYLREFSVEVPPQHSHFHSNFINILVETGWLGLAMFLLWFARTLSLIYSARKDDPLAFGLLAALVSWQIAGLVEYNIGDSEVFVLILIQIGGVLAPLIINSGKHTGKIFSASEKTREMISAPSIYSTTTASE